ncbi:hypothetical protein [Pseudomonas sp. FEN]|uniref:hypothetical protein n=1 Tax=Pseudomonas sp. FEN TaxID=2767468 RepID=UPI00174D3BB2|nr:hypothetical protein [Pseudomonas sp. FEN]
MNPFRPGWPIRRRLLWIRLKAGLRARLIKGMTLIFRLRAAHRCLPLLPAILLRLPSAWRGPDYNACRQNLELFGLEPRACQLLACRYSAIQLQCAIYQALYPRNNPERLRAWIRAVTWHDPEQHWSRTRVRSTIIVLAHTGEYWMAVACMIERCPAPKRFIIPIWNFNDPLTRRSLQSLEAFGHAVDILDSNDPKTALAIARALKRGDQVLIFADLPVSFAGARSGEPADGRLFGRAAQFVKGPMFLAAKMKCDVLLAGHRARLGGCGELHVIQWIGRAAASDMRAQWARAMESFIVEAPEHWFYLSRLEAFYQRQKTSGEKASGLPGLLQRRGIG